VLAAHFSRQALFPFDFLLLFLLLSNVGFHELSLAVAVLAPALSAYATKILVLVGPDNQVCFNYSMT
jgi:hypothetical protein